MPMELCDREKLVEASELIVHHEDSVVMLHSISKWKEEHLTKLGVKFNIND